MNVMKWEFMTTPLVNRRRTEPAVQEIINFMHIFNVAGFVTAMTCSKAIYVKLLELLLGKSICTLDYNLRIFIFYSGLHHLCWRYSIHHTFNAPTSAQIEYFPFSLGYIPLSAVVSSNKILTFQPNFANSTS